MELTAFCRAGKFSSMSFSGQGLVNCAEVTGPMFASTAPWQVKIIQSRGLRHSRVDHFCSLNAVPCIQGTRQFRLVRRIGGIRLLFEQKAWNSEVSSKIAATAVTDAGAVADEQLAADGEFSRGGNLKEKRRGRHSESGKKGATEVSDSGAKGGLEADEGGANRDASGEGGVGEAGKLASSASGDKADVVNVKEAKLEWQLSIFDDGQVMSASSFADMAALTDRSELCDEFFSVRGDPFCKFSRAVFVGCIASLKKTAEKPFVDCIIEECGTEANFNGTVHLDGKQMVFASLDLKFMD